MERMTRINEWLSHVSDNSKDKISGLTHHQQGPDRVVQKDSSRYYQHGKTKQLVQLLPINGKSKVNG